MRSRRITRVAASMALVASLSAFVLMPATGAHAAAFATSGAPTGSEFASTASKPTSLPRFGDRGPSVTALQKALIAAGATVSGGADGFFGSATRRAVASFQTANGLVASGDVDATTGFLLGLGASPALPARGQSGSRVTALQNALVAAGVQVSGGVDGRFGQGTQSAVSAFQSSRGLPATGVVDIRTAIALGIVPGSTTPTTTPATTVPATTAPSTSMPASTTNVIATLGAAGSTVTHIQRALIAAGITIRGGADGRFGAATEDAVRRFQTDLRLTPTGQVDDTTAILLGVRPTPSLPSVNDRGDLVRTLQNNLIAAGIPVTGGADGRFGPATTAAVSAFQTAQGIPATGTVDLRTALYLGLIGSTIPSNTVPSNSGPSNTVGVPTTSTSIPGSGAAITPAIFPLPGPCWFSDTWQAARSGGRKHEGVDIIAKKGTPLYAVVDGTITRQFFDRPGSLGGNALRLTATDGTYFHYAHLDTFAQGITAGSTVTVGQLIGYVGTTGSSSTPHLHFEYHPFGGKAVNPYPVVKPLDACRNSTGTTTTTTPTTTTTVAPA